MANSNISFPLLWAAFYTLGIDKFFHPGFFLEIATIDLFILQLGHFQNPSKIGKIKDLESFLIEFQTSPGCKKTLFT